MLPGLRGHRKKREGARAIVVYRVRHVETHRTRECPLEGSTAAQGSAERRLASQQRNCRLPGQCGRRLPDMGGESDCDRVQRNLGLATKFKTRRRAFAAPAAHLAMSATPPTEK